MSKPDDHRSEVEAWSPMETKHPAPWSCVFIHGTGILCLISVPFLLIAFFESSKKNDRDENELLGFAISFGFLGLVFFL